MTPESAALNYFFLVLAVSGLGAACCGWRAYARDAFRQRVFALRDQLFDYAAAGNIEFNHPAYWRLRLMMNNTIRFSHRITFGEMLLPVAIDILRNSDEPDAPSYAAWKEKVQALPAANREAIMEFFDKFSELLAAHLITTSPVAWPVFALAAIIHGLREVRVRVVHSASATQQEEIWGENGGRLQAA